jgi:hypothetical protein
MSDSFDDANKDTDDRSIRAALIRRIRTEGALAAFEASLSLCKDTKAPANARATAANCIFRAGGYFENSGDDDGGGKDLSQMTPDEIDAELNKAKAALARSESRKKPKGGLFD